MHLHWCITQYNIDVYNTVLHSENWGNSGVIFIAIENRHADRSSYPVDEAVGISHSTNSFGKGMDLTTLPTVNSRADWAF